jgi:CRP-like cAMP-binding protein
VNVVSCQFCLAQGNCSLALTQPHWGELVQSAKIVNFRKGTTIYRQGFTAEGIFLLCRGSIKLTTIDNAGAERIAAFVICGELFGMDCLFQECVRCFTAVARENSQGAFLSTLQFHKALHAKPELLWNVSLMLNDMFHRASLDKLAISGLRVRERIESVLRDLAERAKQFVVVGKPTFAKLSQREMAGMLGVPEETISRELRAMRDARKAEVLDVRKHMFKRQSPAEAVVAVRKVVGGVLR